MMNGVFVVDKPSGLSSHQAVQKVRRLANQRRVGHLGTLDPIATGVLPLVIGKATRLSQFFLGHVREYETTVRCGFSTSTYDRAGSPTSDIDAVDLNPGTVERALSAFRGPILQTPPPVSAKKVDGVRAYKLARANKPVELEPAEVEVYDLTLLAVDGDRFRLRMRCSAGGYVRSLAHDLGTTLGCGAHVEELRRTAMGQFTLEDAWTFDRLEQLTEQGRLEDALIPATRVLPEIPGYRVDHETAARIAHGQDFRIHTFSAEPPPSRVMALDRKGDLLAIGEMRLPWTYHPIIVF